MTEAVAAIGAHEILITRPKDESAALAARLHARGFFPVIAPLLHIRRIHLRVPQRIDAILVTSGNAVYAVTGLAAPVLAVGDATAERARAAGLDDVTSAQGAAGDLLALAQTRCDAGAHLLLASGQGQGHALAQQLRASGFRVHRRTVYAARSAARLPAAACQALNRGRLRAALFLSSETARTFVNLFPANYTRALAGIDALAISQRTADALAPLPWGRVRVSVGPTLDDVLALL